MTVDKEKLSYLGLLMDEPIYVIKSEKIMAIPPSVASSAPPQTIVPEVTPLLGQAVVQKPVTKNKNKVLILFNNEQSPYLPKAEEALLKKILFSIKLDIDDVDLVNYNNIQRVDYMDLLKDKILNQLISFGVSLTTLNLQLYLKKYQVENIEGVDMLLADSLSDLENSADKKKLLWKGLQHMFMKK